MNKRFSPEAIIATFFGIGKFPFMPGTIGSFVAIILVWLIFNQPHPIMREGIEYWVRGDEYLSHNYIIYFISFLSVFFCILGTWASDKYIREIDDKDPSRIIIDEVASVFLASSLIAITYSILLLINEKEFILYLMLSNYFYPAVFILFRIFDIIKPWHVGKAERKYTGGFGIMADDLVAGIYTSISFYIIFFALKYFGVLDSMIKV